MSAHYHESRESSGRSGVPLRGGSMSHLAVPDPRVRAYHHSSIPPMAHSSGGDIKPVAGWDMRYPPNQYGMNVASAPDIGGEYVTAAAASYIPPTLAFEHNHWPHQPNHAVPKHPRPTGHASHHSHFAPPPLASTDGPSDHSTMAMHAGRPPMLAPDIPAYTDTGPRRVKPMAYGVSQSHYNLRGGATAQPAMVVHRPDVRTAGHIVSRSVHPAAPEQVIQSSSHKYRLPPSFVAFHSDPRHGISQSKFFEGASSLDISGSDKLLTTPVSVGFTSPASKPPIPGDSPPLPPGIGFSSSENSSDSKSDHFELDDRKETNEAELLMHPSFTSATADRATAETTSASPSHSKSESLTPIREDAVAATSGELTRIGRPKSRCPHFDTSSMIYADCCQQWFGCIICHDFIMLNSDRPHYLIPSTVSKMICLKCKTTQACSQYCYQCQNELCLKSKMSSRRMLKLSAVSEYYCPVCKYWDSNKPLEKFHCVGCNQCRIRDKPSLRTFDASSPAVTAAATESSNAKITMVKPDSPSKSSVTVKVTRDLPLFKSGSSSKSGNKATTDIEVMNDFSLMSVAKDVSSESEKSDDEIKLKNETRMVSVNTKSPPMVKRDLSISDSSSLSTSQKRALDKEQLQMIRKKATIQADSDTDSENEDSGHPEKSPDITEEISTVTSEKEVTVIDDSSGLVFLDTAPIKDANSSNDDTNSENEEDETEYQRTLFERPSLRMIDEAKPEQPTPKAELPSVLTMKVTRTSQSAVSSPAGSVHSPLTPNVELCSLCRITANAKLRMSACRARLRKQPVLAKCIKCDCGLATQGPYWTEVFFSCFKHGYHLECIESSSELVSECPICASTPEGTSTPSTISPISRAGGRVGTPPHGLMAPRTSASQVQMPSLGLTPGMLRALMESRTGVFARPVPGLHSTVSDRMWAARSPHGSLSLTRMGAVSDQTMPNRRSGSSGFRKKKKKDKKRNTLESPMTVTSRFYGTISFVIGERMQRLLAESKFDDIPFNSLLTTALQNRCTDSENGYKLFRRHGFKFYFTQALDEWCDVSIVPKQLQKFREKGAKQRKKREQDKAKHFIEKRIQKRLEKQRAAVMAGGSFRGDGGGGSVSIRHSNHRDNPVSSSSASSSKPVPRMTHRSASDGDWRSRATHRSRRQR